VRVDLVWGADVSPTEGISGRDPGGPAERLLVLARTLAGLGAQVRIHARRDAPGLDPVCAVECGIAVHHIDAGPARPLSAAEALLHAGRLGRGVARAQRREAADILHCDGWTAGVAGLSAAREAGVAVVQAFHGFGTRRRGRAAGGETDPPERVLLERGLAREAHRIIAGSADEVLDLVREGVSRERISRVPRGVDVACFTPEGPRENRVGRRPRIACVAGPSGPEGVADVIRAVAAVPDAELVVVVGRPSRLGRESDAAGLSRLHAMACDLGVAHRTQIRGCRASRAVATLLRSADVAVCMPRHDATSVVPLEAMACGVPVIAASVGEMAESVVDGVHGILVPPQHPPRLAAALRTLLADEVLRARMGAAGVDHVRRRHTWRRVAEETLAVYGRTARAVAKARRRPARGGTAVIRARPVGGN
jgi:glycosyltransferase involved in cell wall biosynthesis